MILVVQTKEIIMMAMRETRVATMREEEDRAQEEDKTRNETDSGREGNHGVEESKSFEPEDLPHNKRRRDSQEEEMPKSCCQNDDENSDDSSGESKKDGKSTPKRSRVQDSSLGRHVQFSSVIATVSVFNPENSVVPPTTLGPGVPDSGL